MVKYKQQKREKNKVAGFVKYIIRALAVAAFIPSLAFGAQAPNPRTVKTTASRNQTSDANSSIRRSATSVIARSTALNGRKTVTVRPAITRSGSKGVAATRSARKMTTKDYVARGATSRNNKINNKPIFSRAAKSSARPTAVFNDVTKIGGGYAACRDSYATCMDQFCAIANDTYRRCYCSDRFTEFRDAYDNIDAALGMLTDFQNNNLNAVDKTASEVNAMYSSTAGEMAIKKDTSASQKMLDEIGDILAGKKTNKNVSTSSLGVLNYGELTDMGDIWSGSGSSIFGSGGADDVTGLEGRALYQRAAGQCAAVVKDACAGDAMFNLASSAYSIMVTQDCNAFEKNIDAKKESVMQTVRQAEKVLRDARLDEYRAHNSQDVNECLTRVEMAITNPMACGEGYKRCLDYTGEYINLETGEPIYSPRLFKMMDTIAPTLGDVDVIGKNANWNKLLEDKKKFVATALDTCRSLADDVWKEFKRTAVIRIAQAQEAKIQEIKDSCVDTIKDCYNTNDETLAELTEDTITDSKYDVSAGRAVTVRNLCYEKVMTCAALYGDPNGCTYNRSTRKIEAAAPDKQCGLKALLSYIDTVDSVRVAQGCEETLVAKAHEMCDAKAYAYTTTNADGTTYTAQYPDGCRDKSLEYIRSELQKHAEQFCAIDMAGEDRANINSAEQTTLNMSMINDAVNAVYKKLVNDLNDNCGYAVLFSPMGFGDPKGFANIGWGDKVVIMTDSEEKNTWPAVKSFASNNKCQCPSLTGTDGTYTYSLETAVISDVVPQDTAEESKKMLKSLVYGYTLDQVESLTSGTPKDHQKVSIKVSPETSIMCSFVYK